MRVVRRTQPASGTGDLLLSRIPLCMGPTSTRRRAGRSTSRAGDVDADEVGIGVGVGVGSGWTGDVGVLCEEGRGGGGGGW